MCCSVSIRSEFYSQNPPQEGRDRLRPWTGKASKHPQTFFLLASQETGMVAIQSSQQLISVQGQPGLQRNHLEEPEFPVILDEISSC